MCQVLELCLLINISYVPRVSSMPFNTMAVICQVWAVCLSIQWQSCAKCEQYDCQYNVSHLPSVTSMTVNTMSVMCQVWAVCLSIQCQSCAKCEQYDCQYVNHVPSVSSMTVNTMCHVPRVSSMPVNTMAVMCQVSAVCLLSMLGPLLLKSKHECAQNILNALILHFKASINSLHNFHQHITRQ